MEEIRHVLVTNRYEYTLSQRHDAYYVLCCDTQGSRRLEHGPMSLVAAQAMIDARVQRGKDAR